MTVKCPKCNADNPDAQKFCGECATPLQISKDIDVTKTIEAPIEEYSRGSTFADRYKIIEKLGIGGMGAVYRVEDTNIGQAIALRLFKSDIASDKKTIERFPQRTEDHTDDLPQECVSDVRHGKLDILNPYETLSLDLRFLCCSPRFGQLTVKSLVPFL